MAKIGNLAVDTLNIVPAAITTVSVGNPIGVSNPAALPIEIHGTSTIQYQGVASGSNGSATYRIRRNRDNAILFEESYGFNGSGGGAALVNASILDDQATASETYRVEELPSYSPGTPGGQGGVTMNSSHLYCLAVKK
ncbi:hypothetical protein [Aliihoeflea sp. 2WW]|uniref:hypothetical protein n=1 Tax=Aliihoeflea sp. 2WW TaxID=1381123 RepID=UPI000465DBE5|nr:hypothetical protein [Aliihoeflea sp. 2WW]